MLREYYQVVEYNFASKNKRVIYEFDTMIEALKYVNNLSQDYIKCSYHITTDKKFDFKNIALSVLFLIGLLYFAI